MSSPTPTRRTNLKMLGAVCLAGAVLVSLTLPELAEAALKNAAGGGAGGGGGFAALTRYLDRLASFLIPVGAAASVLGLISGGVMFMFGNPAAMKVLGYVALGVVIVLASKGLAA